MSEFSSVLDELRHLDERRRAGALEPQEEARFQELAARLAAPAPPPIPAWDPVAYAQQLIAQGHHPVQAYSAAGYSYEQIAAAGYDVAPFLSPPGPVVYAGQLIAQGHDPVQAHATAGLEVVTPTEPPPEPPPLENPSGWLAEPVAEPVLGIVEGAELSPSEPAVIEPVAVEPVAIEAQAAAEPVALAPVEAAEPSPLPSEPVALSAELAPPEPVAAVEPEPFADVPAASDSGPAAIVAAPLIPIAFGVASVLAQAPEGSTEKVAAVADPSIDAMPVLDPEALIDVEVEGVVAPTPVEEPAPGSLLLDTPGDAPAGDDPATGGWTERPTPAAEPPPHVELLQLEPEPWSASTPPAEIAWFPPRKVAVPGVDATAFPVPDAFSDEPAPAAASERSPFDPVEPMVEGQGEMAALRLLTLAPVGGEPSGQTADLLVEPMNEAQSEREQATLDAVVVEPALAAPMPEIAFPEVAEVAPSEEPVAFGGREVEFDGSDEGPALEISPGAHTAEAPSVGPDAAHGSAAMAGLEGLDLQAPVLEAAAEEVPLELGTSAGAPELQSADDVALPELASEPTVTSSLAAAGMEGLREVEFEGDPSLPVDLGTAADVPAPELTGIELAGEGAAQPLELASPISASAVPEGSELPNASELSEWTSGDRAAWMARRSEAGLPVHSDAANLLDAAPQAETALPPTPEPEAVDVEMLSGPIDIPPGLMDAPMPPAMAPVDPGFSMASTQPVPIAVPPAPAVDEAAMPGWGFGGLDALPSFSTPEAAPLALPTFEAPAFDAPVFEAPVAAPELAPLPAEPEVVAAPEPVEPPPPPVFEFAAPEPLPAVEAAPVETPVFEPMPEVDPSTSLPWQAPESEQPVRGDTELVSAPLFEAPAAIEPAVEPDAPVASIAAPIEPEPSPWALPSEPVEAAAPAPAPAAAESNPWSVDAGPRPTTEPAWGAPASPAPAAPQPSAAISASAWDVGSPPPDADGWNGGAAPAWEAPSAAPESARPPSRGSLFGAPQSWDAASEEAPAAAAPEAVEPAWSAPAPELPAPERAPVEMPSFEAPTVDANEPVFEGVVMEGEVVFEPEEQPSAPEPSAQATIQVERPLAAAPAPAESEWGAPMNFSGEGASGWSSSFGDGASAWQAPAPAPQPQVASWEMPVAEPEPTGELFVEAEPEPLPTPTPPPPPRVQGEHRVIVHLVDGQVRRGTLRDQLLDGTVTLHAPTGPEAVPLERTRAIFFLLPPGTTGPAPAGQRVRITFHDGRQVVGFSNDVTAGGALFSLIPAEQPSNTSRIVVMRHAVRAAAPA